MRRLLRRCSVLADPARWRAAPRPRASTRRERASGPPPSVRHVMPAEVPAPRGRGVAVAAPNDLAAQAGVGVAVDGGNAVDAAVAAAITTMVTEPGLVSLTAGGFVLLQPEEIGRASCRERV